MFTKEEEQKIQDDIKSLEEGKRILDLIYKLTNIPTVLMHKRLDEYGNKCKPDEVNMFSMDGSEYMTLDKVKKLLALQGLSTRSLK
jgi:hypothetical protein